jgi:hypothetical protein
MLSGESAGGRGIRETGGWVGRSSTGRMSSPNCSEQRPMRSPSTRNRPPTGRRDTCRRPGPRPRMFPRDSRRVTRRPADRQPGPPARSDRCACPAPVSAIPFASIRCRSMGGEGRIGMTLCPGKKGESVDGPPWDRDLRLDLAAVKGGGAEVVVSPHGVSRAGDTGSARSRGRGRESRDALAASSHRRPRGPRGRVSAALGVVWPLPSWDSLSRRPGAPALPGRSGTDRDSGRAAAHRSWCPVGGRHPGGEACTAGSHRDGRPGAVPSCLRRGVTRGFRRAGSLTCPACVIGFRSSR